MACVYILRCVDQTLYVGSTEDVEARVAVHNEGRGGRYTGHRRPVQLVFVETHGSMESARRRERLEQTPCHAALTDDRVVFPNRKAPEVLRLKWLANRPLQPTSGDQIVVH